MDQKIFALNTSLTQGELNSQPRRLRRNYHASGFHGGGQPDQQRHFIGISDVTMRFGVTARALRFYEAKGLLHPLREGNLRLYDSKQLVRVELILKGKQLGFTLAEIRSLVSSDDPVDGSSDLPLTGERLLQQISMMERQQRNTETALAELRRRYCLMQGVSR